MLRVTLQAGDEGEHFLGIKTGGDELIGERGLAIGERAGLSKMAVRHPAICSSTTGLFTMMARRAQSEMELMMAMGMPSRSGHGVAMTSTARKRNESPLRNHASSATTSATGV